MTPFVNRFDIGTLILTYTCPLSCRMCFFGSNPTRKEKLDADIARQFIDDIADLGMHHIGFAGGEPVLRLELLCELITRARKRGLRPIVITSGYWGKTDQQAKSVTAKLRNAGLEWIQLSLDDDHLEFLRIEDYGRALRACKNAGFSDIKIIGTSKGNSKNFGDLLLYVETVLGVSTNGLDLRDRYRVSHGDYVSEQTDYLIDDLYTNTTKPSCMTEIMVDVNADVYPCCQNFIGRIGNLKGARISDILNLASRNKAIQFMTEHDPIKFAKKLDRECGTSFSEQKYGSWCEVCSKIFRNKGFEDSLLHPIKDFRELASLTLAN